jgi:hypothetical protein
VSVDCHRQGLSAVRRRTQVFAEERENMILESVGDCAGMRAGINLEAVSDPIVIEDVV